MLKFRFLKSRSKRDELIDTPIIIRMPAEISFLEEVNSMKVDVGDEKQQWLWFKIVNSSYKINSHQ